ncbi:MAG: hypothetical protein HYS07_06500 [Chlamydiae bacterium]|nr:hypothetical protein [Chlamydiota bacterium]
MPRLSKSTRSIFREWGREGGEKRARLLSRERRSRIAAKAAQKRWGSYSIRLKSAYWNDPVYLEEILSEGTLQTWRKLYHRLKKKPMGPTALSLEKVLASVKLYGVISLWREILKKIRDHES